MTVISRKTTLLTVNSRETTLLTFFLFQGKQLLTLLVQGKQLYCYFRFNDISISVRTICVQSAVNFVLHHPELVKDVIGMYDVENITLTCISLKYSLIIIKYFALLVFTSDNQ